MTKRRLGKTGLAVTPIALGGAYLGRTRDGYDEDLAVETVLKALQMGVNLIDTSPLYGRGESEKRIGRALTHWYAAGGRREDLIISTKVGTRGRTPENRHSDYSGAATRSSMALSLEALDTDYVDIALIHDPTQLDVVLAPGGAWETLAELKEEGTVRHIGLGVRDHALHRSLIEAGRIEVALTHSDYHLLRRSALEGVISPAARHGVGVMLGSPTMRGLLGGEEPMGQGLDLGDPKIVSDAQELWAWSRDRGLSVLTLNLQFCLRTLSIATVLVGASVPAQVEADVKALDETVPAAVWDDLERFLRL